MSEWVGSLADLMAMIEAEALPSCIVVLSPGSGDSVAGEIHLLAGGLSDAFAGSLRRDDAVAALKRIEGARYLVETRLPDPESGSLVTPAQEIGSLTERPLAGLMRYCEDYVLSGRLTVRKGADQAVIQYKKGELVGTVVNGSEDPEALPSVLGWAEGDYILQLPKIPGTRPQGPQGALPTTRAANTPSDHRRHATLPLQPSMEVAPPPPPVVSNPPPAPLRPMPMGPPQERTAVYSSHVPVVRTTPPTPPRVMDVGASDGTPPPLFPPLPSPGTGTAPPVPGFPGPAARPVAPPVRPVVPVAASARSAGPGGAPVKPAPPSPSGLPGALPAKPVAASTSAPRPAVPAKPAPPIPAVPPLPPTPPPIAVSSTEAPTARKPAPVTPAKPRPAKQPSGISNDLKPASGTIEGRTIEGRSVARSSAPASTAPVEVAPVTPKPIMLPAPMGQVTPPVVRVPQLPEGRRHNRARKPGAPGPSVRTYIFVGLAVGIGVVLAYWAYWYLPPLGR